MSDVTATAAVGGRNIRLFGFLCIFAGMLAIAAPLLTGMSIALLVGILVLMGGAARMVWAFQAGSLGKGMLTFAIGGLTLLCGIVLVTDPVIASGILTIVLAAYLAIDGAVEIFAAFQVRPAPGWGFLMMGGMISLLLGLMIWRQFPLSGAWAIGVLLGLKLLMVGMISITVGSVAKADA